PLRALPSGGSVSPGRLTVPAGNAARAADTTLDRTIDRDSHRPSRAGAVADCRVRPADFSLVLPRGRRLDGMLMTRWPIDPSSAADGFSVGVGLGYRFFGEFDPESRVGVAVAWPIASGDAERL